MKETKSKNKDIEFITIPPGVVRQAYEPPLLQSPLLKAEEVCRIISTCARSNVTVLKFRDLHVEFGPTPIQGKKAVKESSPENSASVDPAPIAPEAEISENAKRIDTETLERDELFLREMQIQESVMTEPLEFEKGLASGDLENGEFDSEA